MARTMRSPKLETRSSRLKLPMAKRPDWTQIGKGVSIGYRRNQGPGTWNVRVAHRTGHWSKAIGTADDYAEAGAGDVLDYWQAATKAREIGHAARYGGGGKLGTVGEALDAYETALRSVAPILATQPAFARTCRRLWRPRLSGRCGCATSPPGGKP